MSSELDHHNLSQSAAVYSWGCNLARSRESGIKFVSLIEIAALGSGPLNKSYKWHASPVSWTPPPIPTPVFWPFLYSCRCWCLSLCSNLYRSVSRTTSFVKLELNTDCRRTTASPDTCRIAVRSLSSPVTNIIQLGFGSNMFDMNCHVSCAHQ